MIRKKSDGYALVCKSCEIGQHALIELWVYYQRVFLCFTQNAADGGKRVKWLCNGYESAACSYWSRAFGIKQRDV